MMRRRGGSLDGLLHPQAQTKTVSAKEKGLTS